MPTLLNSTDAGLAAKVEQVDLFARVDPDQKKRIIDALRIRGHVTGFLGDGINDAPAIHAAHVGLSVEGATDVARAAADMILLASDLNVLAEGVREGRRTFANILKYVRMGTSSNFGNMLSMALASIVLPFLPLLPLQILLNNLLYDLSEIGIPFDAVDAEDTARPHAWDMAVILRFTIVMGIGLVRIRRGDISNPSERLRHRCGAISDRMVPGVDRNADPGDFPDPNPASAVARDACAYRLDRDFAGCARRRTLRGHRSAANSVRVRAAFVVADGRAGRRDGRLSGGGGSRQAVRDPWCLKRPIAERSTHFVARPQVSTCRLAEMEVTASQRNDFVVGRVIARLNVEVARLVRVRTLLEMLQQQCLLVSGTDKQDRFAVL